MKTETKTALEYGLFALAAHPRIVANNFLFFTEAAGNTKVMGNMFHVNLYGAPETALTWNLGAGYMYHRIEPPHGSIEVHAPIAKLGAVLRIASWGLSFNPYIGHVWELIDTPRGGRDNDAYLYGVTVDWRWRMLNVNAKYYYQDSREQDEGLNNIHLRLITGITRHCGAVLRMDHKEHTITEDSSVLVGPVYVF